MPGKRQKHKTNIHSAEIHITAHKPAPSPMTTSKKVTIGVIVGTMLAVIAMVVFCLVYQPSDDVKAKLARISENYYENYLYDNITSSEQFKQINDINKAMEKYHDKGFTRVTLRQLVLHEKINEPEISNDSKLVRNICNENRTYVQFFPDPPYDKKSYHVEYHYSCNF